MTSTPTPSTNVTSSPSSSISSLTIDEKIHSAAKALAESTSFSMNYNYDGEDFTDIYNIEKGYIYIDYDQSGYITLPYKDEKQIYVYSVDNNSIALEGRPENESGYAEFEDLLYGLPALATKISTTELTGNDYIQSNIENSDHYYFSTETNKANFFNLVDDSYSDVMNSYQNSLDLLVEVSNWYRNVVLGG